MFANKNILITGGLGYIGSHIAYQLLSNGYQVIVVDRHIHEKKQNFNALKGFPSFTCIEGNLLSFDMNKICNKYKIDTVIHCAGRKNFIEAFCKPDLYIQENLNITKNIIKNIQRNKNVKNFIFLSTCMVYQNNFDKINDEDLNLSPTHPYALSKFMEETILQKELQDINLCILRCFNPIGCNYNVGLGEDIYKSSTISSAIIKSLISKEKTFNIYGNQFDTIDGTCVRDYFDINSISEFIKTWLENSKSSPQRFDIFNIGSGTGTTVLQLIETFERCSNISLNKNYIQERFSEAPHIVANINKATSIGWKQSFSIEKACLDVLKYHQIVKL